MTRQINRVISLVVVLALTVSLWGPWSGLVPTAQAAVATADGFTYEVENNTARIIGTTRTGTVTFPSSIGGYPVTSLGTYMSSSSLNAKDKDAVTGLVIPEGIKRIEGNTFQGFSNVTSVTLPKGLLEIGRDAFAQCWSLSAITIPDTVTTLGSDAFHDSGLTEISLPGSIRSWGEHTFSMCDGLKRVSIANGSTTLSVAMFAWNKSLTEVKLPNTLREIPDSLFQGCAGLTGVSIPSEVTVIGNRAFEDCTSLERIYIPQSVTSLDETAFTMCKALTDIYYGGTEAQWKALIGQSIDESRDKATVHFNSAGPDSGTDPETPLEIPTPTLMKAQNQNEGISIHWSLPVNLPSMGALPAGFHILRKTEGGKYEKIATVNDIGATSYLDTKVEWLQTYTYTVQMFVEDEVGDYDAKGLTTTRVAKVTDYSPKYPNDQLGWSVPNNATSLGRDDGYAIPRERYDEALGVNFGQKCYNMVKSAFTEIFSEDGFCHGMSLLAAAQYNRQIDLSTQFPNAKSGDSLANFAITGTWERDKGQYFGSLNKETTIQTIERAHLLQYSVPFKETQVYSAQPNYQGLLNYLKTDNTKPLLVCMSGGLTGHTVLTYPGMAPESLGNGWYKVYLYDPNAPQIGSASILKRYVENGTIHPYYTADQPYLLIHTSSGDWEYYNPAQGKGALSSSGYYVPDLALDWNDQGEHGLYSETIQFYDISKLPKSVLEKTGADVMGNIFVIPQFRDSNLTAKPIPGSTGPALTVKRGASGDTELTFSDTLVKDYTLCGPDNETLLVWLTDECQKLTVSGDDFEGLYLSGDTMFSVTAAGQAEVTLDPDSASVAYQAKDSGEIDLTVQRNAHGEDEDILAASIDTTLSRGETATLTLDRNGTPSVSGPEGKTYTMTGQRGSGTYVVIGATEEELEDKFGGTIEDFTDVPKDAYYYDAVQWAVENEVTTGTGNGKFSPNAVCTRAQMVTFLYRASGSPSVSGSPSFTDVPQNAYYADAVKWAVDHNITTGTGNGKFSPNDVCSRAQTVTFLWRAQNSPNVGGRSPFQDVDANAYYYKAVLWADHRDITHGTSATTFAPDDQCTRAQIVTFLYRCFGA